ncbi:uncharacterized protein A4U43_C06F6970 [Asparagus officinalis]|uniref:Proteasome subunit alpha type n=1 Tax=Asparagus officinalis TaxID=4686 RepID=A0A5P1EKQ8_ASPOF|nr:uncharacterized protein A4U43_C06F6970 [Asparagus officinalis]
MSRRYDSRTTIFSPEGRLYQVEYAMEAIGNAGSAIGILAKDGVVLVGEKKVTSKLLQTSKSTEKMYKIDDHVACAVAGIMSDANILINTARVQAQRYTFSYQEPMPVEQLVQSLCDTKQGYTQYWFSKTAFDLISHFTSFLQLKLDMNDETRSCENLEPNTVCIKMRLENEIRGRASIVAVSYINDIDEWKIFKVIDIM